jgi:hypothetical protein
MQSLLVGVMATGDLQGLHEFRVGLTCSKGSNYYDTTLENLRHSARDGCCWCALLLDNVYAKQSNNTSQLLSHRISFPFPISNREIRLLTACTDEWEAYMPQKYRYMVRSAGTANNHLNLTHLTSPPPKTTPRHLRP